jgi:hypothetical protein
MAAVLLTQPFVADFPCVQLAASSGTPGMNVLLTLQVDTAGQYEVLLPWTTASGLDFMPGFFPASIRLLDGTYRSAGTGTIRLDANWISDQMTFRLRILRAFNLINHPPRIDGYVGEDFFKKADVIVQVDYGSREISLLR